MNIEIYTATLPEHLAPFAMYGDDSATGDDSESAYETWFKDTMKHEGFTAMILVDVPDEGQGFMAWHDLKEYGVGSCDSCEFIFHVERKAKA